VPKNINLTLGDEEYSDLSEFKDDQGFTWKEVLKYGTDSE